MKKMLAVLVLAMLTYVLPSYADTSVSVTGSTTTNTMGLTIGKLDLMLPIKSGVGPVYLYDFVGKRSLVGAETPFATIQSYSLNLNFVKLNTPVTTFTFGGVTTLQGSGSPFIGAHMELLQYLPTSVINVLSLGGLANPSVGGFGGRDFGAGKWMGGLKTSFMFNIPWLQSL